jgi:hypothetical protein
MKSSVILLLVALVVVQLQSGLWGAAAQYGPTLTPTVPQDPDSIGAYITSLVLPDPPANGVGQFPPPQYENFSQAGYVDSSAGFGFTAAVSAVHKQDIISAMLLAQLNSNKLFNRYSQPLDWFGNYVTVLSNIGYAVSAFSFANVGFSGNSVQVAQSALGILKELVSGNELTVATAILNSLQNQNSDQFTLFASQSVDENVGNFQFQLVDEIGGAMTAKFSGFLMNTQTDQYQFLWFTWQTSQITLQYADSQFVQSDSVWNSGVRQQVYTKVAAYTTTYIDQLDI